MIKRDSTRFIQKSLTEWRRIRHIRYPLEYKRAAWIDRMNPNARWIDKKLKEIRFVKKLKRLKYSQ